MSTKSEWSEAFEYAKQYGGDYYNYIGSPEYWDDLMQKKYIADLAAKKKFEIEKKEQQNVRDLQSALNSLEKRESLISFLNEKKEHRNGLEKKTIKNFNYIDL